MFRRLLAPALFALALFVPAALVVAQDPGRIIVANQSVAYTGTAAQSSAFNAATVDIVVVCTTDCYFAVGSNPTATTGDHYLAAFSSSPVVRAPAGGKVSIIRDTASGTAKIAEYNR